jgi:stage II sporulation protein D
VSVALFLASLSVLVLGRHAPERIEVRHAGGSTTLRASDTTRVAVRDAAVRVPGKVARSYPGPLEIEARKGLVRSMVPFLIGRHRGADVCDLTHCQVYVGHAGAERFLRAARATAGRVLRFDGVRVPAPFHSACGGHTEPGDGFFAASAPHLTGISDGGLCRASPSFRWEVRLTPRDLMLLGAPVIRASTRAERVALYRLAGSRLGWNVLRSARVAIRRVGSDIVVRGEGLGHGVGLCQWGAEALARQGRTAEEILTYYFPGAKVGT